MSAATTAALRVILLLGLLGSVLVEAVLVPLLFLDLDDAPAAVRVQVVLIVLLGIVAMQAVMVCTWRLLTLVGRDEVFSPASFRYVDAISVAVGAGALLLFWLGAVAAPGEAVFAPSAEESSPAAWAGAVDWVGASADSVAPRVNGRAPDDLAMDLPPSAAIPSPAPELRALN